MLVVIGPIMGGAEKFFAGLKPEYRPLIRKYPDDMLQDNRRLEELYGDEHYRNYQSYLRDCDADAMAAFSTGLRKEWPNGLWITGAGINRSYWEIADMADHDGKVVVRFSSEFALILDDSKIDKVLFFISDPHLCFYDTAVMFNRLMALANESSGDKVRINMAALMQKFNSIRIAATNFKEYYRSYLINLAHLKDLYGDKLTVIRTNIEIPGSISAYSSGLVMDDRNPNSLEPLDNMHGMDESGFNELRAEALSVIVNNQYIGQSTISKAGQINLLNAKDWYCIRAGRFVKDDLCELCRNTHGEVFLGGDQTFMSADDWKNQPCAWECAYNINGARKTIEDSIANNSWEVLP